MFRARLRLFVVLSATVSVVLLCFFACSSKAEAAASGVEKLLNKTPDNVLGFIATSGADELKPAFDKTILGRMWNDPGTQTFYQSIKNELFGKIKAEVNDPNKIKAFETVRDFVQLVLHRPIIIGAASKDAKEKIPVYGFAILDAGNRKAEIISQLAKLEALAGDGKIIEVNIGSQIMHRPKDSNDVDAYWGWVGNYLVFVINESEGQAIKYLENAKDISAINYLSKVPCSGDGLVVYGDYGKGISLLEATVRKEGKEKEYNQFKAAVDELGITKIRSLVARVGFSGSDLVVDEFIQMSSPLTGLPASFKPAELSMLDMVDNRAMNTVALNCDVAAIYDTILRAIKVASPNEAYPEITKKIAELESEAKFQLRSGLLENLSGPMVCYTLPAGVMMEIPSGGSVLIAKLKDKVLFEQTMLAIGQFAAAKSDGMLQVSSQVQNGRTQYTWVISPLAMMQVMPTWTIVDDYVVIATNTALCNSAIAQMTSKTNSIRNTEGYKSATAKIPQNPLLLGYTDSKVQFNQTMMCVQRFWPMVTMMASKGGVKLPFMLPSLSHIVNDMQPACCYCWSDSEGYYFHYRGTGTEQSVGSVAGVSLAMGIMMPALAKVREQSRILISATNLSKIGKAFLIYANDNNDKYPPNLQVLIEKANLLPKTLESPLKPKGFSGPSYIYLTGQSPISNPLNILVYENPEFCKAKISVLFNDGHVETMQQSRFIELLKETCARLGIEMPNIRFNAPEFPTETHRDNIKSSTKNDELVEASREGDIAKVKTLIDGGADVNFKGSLDWTALHMAVRLGHTDVAALLIDKGANIYARTNEGMTPLRFAVLHERKEIEKLLLARGAKPDIITESIRGNADGVAEMLKNDPNLVNTVVGNFTPLHWAAYQGHNAIAEVLLTNGADINARSEVAVPLYWAIRKNHPDTARLLIAKGADVNRRNKYKVTVLHEVPAAGVAQLLIDSGADINAKDSSGRTPLHAIVSSAGHQGVMKLLIGRDGDISIKQPKELEDKATEEQAAIAELLIAKGADVDAKDNKGYTPLDIAKKFQYKPVIELLEKHQASSGNK